MRIIRTCALVLPLIVALGSPGAAVLGAGPEIFSLSPDQGGAGDLILIRGKHLKDTRRVFFSAGPVVRLAQFKAISDQELEVVAPEFLLPGTEATIAVLTDQGVTVGMPPDAQTVDSASASRSRSAPFSLVKQGGLVDVAQGITVIEDGGIVRGSIPVGMHFVHKGGILLGFTDAEGVVFEERGATYNPRALNKSSRIPPEATRIPVDHISVSLGIQPFRFQAPDQAPGPAGSVPRIERIEPIVATCGDVLDVRGSGFLGTTEVYFFNARFTRPTAAGFRVVSDRHIRVETPTVNGTARPRPPIDFVHPNKQWKWFFAPVRPHFLIVVNPKGATVTVPAAPTGQPLREVYNLLEFVGPGQTSTIDHELYFVESQGLATQPTGLFFLKNGARLATTQAQAVFLEPQAQLPSTLDNAQTRHRVESLHVSPLHRMPVILDNLTY